jgi:Mor family transcriptional regulator
MAYKKKGRYESTELRKVVFNKDEWRQRKDEIKAMAAAGVTMAFMSKKYGVSRQRMYQVIDELNHEGARIAFTKKTKG